MDREGARERMLHLWVALSANCAARTSILTTQSTMVHADTLIANAGQTLFACSNLDTPLGTYKHAVLRDQDITQLERALAAAELRGLVLDDTKTG
ncbi:hypothetical protein PR003_g4574 [Phytophthora rubi]|uniref:Uncharacterized protein n=1 Tax=Phytophthora rubi TaxID=129364 RepID=A0A6A4FW98_9STRA|nr:hypothetical protein PR002_g5379 [Phytophthora rubi]KAE9045641.1 hypothetical protein PR001_g4887 [Phytophthora rubi]KAE9352078.1 hypothetical protein PR003_g4574 [Phytophthora rubi]